MGNYKINVIYNDSGPNINDILIKTLKKEILKKFRNMILKDEKNVLSLDSTYSSHGKCS